MYVRAIHVRQQMFEDGYSSFDVQVEPTCRQSTMGKPRCPCCHTQTGGTQGCCKCHGEQSADTSLPSAPSFPEDSHDHSSNALLFITLWSYTAVLTICKTRAGTKKF